MSSKSDKAIDKAAKKYGYDASAFESAMTQAGSKYTLDPNLLVGLASRESGLNPFQKNGGLFQIQDPASYGLSASDIYSFQAQIPAAAKTLSSNIQSFGGNVDLGIASWTLGLGGTRHLFSSGDMNSVRSAWLDRNHHDYGQSPLLSFPAMHGRRMARIPIPAQAVIYEAAPQNKIVVPHVSHSLDTSQLFTSSVGMDRSSLQ